MKQIIVNSENLQTRVALVHDGRIQEYYIERAGTKQIVGSIYKGRIKNLEPSLQAAFVDIGLRKNAFLHYWDMIPATYDTWESEEEEKKDGGGDDDGNDRGDDREDGGGNSREDNRGNDRRDGGRGGRRDNRRGRRRPDRNKQADEGEKTPPPPAYKPGLTTRIKGLFARSKPEPEAEPAEPAEERQASGQGRQRSNRRRPRPQPRKRPTQTVDVDDIPKMFNTNSEVVVQVSKGLIGDKGPRVTTNLSIPGRYTVLLPNSGHRGVSKRISDRRERVRLRKLIQSIDMPKRMGVICRTASVGLDEETLRHDVEALLQKWAQAEKMSSRRAPVCTYQEPDLLERSIRDMLPEKIDEIVCDSEDAYQRTLGYVKLGEKRHRPRVRSHDSATPIFQHYRLDSQISSIFRRKVTLPSGAELCVDETEALIAIDVNSGRSRGGKGHPETILNTNLEAADEVARQLRLRNIGGLVVVDFIDMRSRKDQTKVHRRMLELAARDRARTKILPLSRLGLMEMTRQREHESLQDSIFESCRYCRGRGIVKSSTSISVELQRRLREVMRRDRDNSPIRVAVHSRVLDRLKNEDAEILETMEEEYGGDLSFRADANLHQEEFHLIDVRTGKEI